MKRAARRHGVAASKPQRDSRRERDERQATAPFRALDTKRPRATPRRHPVPTSTLLGLPTTSSYVVALVEDSDCSQSCAPQRRGISTTNRHSRARTRSERAERHSRIAPRATSGRRCGSTNASPRGLPFTETRRAVRRATHTMSTLAQNASARERRPGSSANPNAHLRRTRRTGRSRQRWRRIPRGRRSVARGSTAPRGSEARENRPPRARCL